MKVLVVIISENVETVRHIESRPTFYYINLNLREATPTPTQPASNPEAVGWR